MNSEIRSKESRNQVFCTPCSLAKRAAAVLLWLVCLGACGYKAAPSPLFDEHERFGDVVRARQMQEQKEREQAPNPAERIHWIAPETPRASSTPPPKPEQRAPENPGTR